MSTTPQAGPAPNERESSLKALAGSWFQRYALDHEDPEKAGRTITREHTCECGRVFTQMILSERQLAAAERLGIVPLLADQIPGFWVPVHCPQRCERLDLARQARLDESRELSRQTNRDSVRDSFRRTA